jgi:hypothetical protein
MCVILLFGSAIAHLAQAADSTAGAPKHQSDQKQVDRQPAAAGGDGPEAFFPQTQFEFDTVMEGAEIKHDFIIENHGSAPLLIKSVRPD